MQSVLQKNLHEKRSVRQTGICRTLDVGRIPENQRLKERGSMLNGLLHGVGEQERIVAMLDLTDADDLDLLFITRKGQLKRTPAEEYRTHARAVSKSSPRA